MKKNQVGDYLFRNDEDALLAEKEAEKVMRLEEKMGDADIELLYRLYNKSLEKHTFKTPIGYDFMRKLKDILESDVNTPGEVLPVILEQHYATDEHIFIEPMKEETVNTKKTNEKSPLFIWSLVTNVVLIILVLLMFWIVSTGDSPNVINCENAVINKYAKWEQELSEKEQELLKRESLLLEAGY